MQGVLLTETGGSWTTGVAAMPTNVANAGSAGFLNSISCASPGNCGALVAGEHLLTETADSWSTGVDPPLPANGVGGRACSTRFPATQPVTAVPWANTRTPRAMGPAC